jgi:hypothetical protein
MPPLTNLKISISLACIVVAVVHRWWLLDTTTLALLSIGILPWLQPIFKTVKLPGGIEITLQDLQRKIDTASGAAESAIRKAEFAAAGINSPEPARHDSSVRETASDSAESLNELAREYEEIRKTQPSGSVRTQAMTAIIRRMIEVAKSQETFDAIGHLRARNPGDRLAGYAYVYAHPDPKNIVALVYSVTSLEGQPFGQYWGLQAVGRCLGQPLAPDVANKIVNLLTPYAARLPNGSDRHYETQRILTQLLVQPP